MTVLAQTRSRTRLAWLAAMVVVLGLLASCSTLDGVIDTESALEDEGFTAVDVSFNSSDGFDELDITVDPGFLEGDGDGLAERAAGVVWTTFPLRFDQLLVVQTGAIEDYETVYSYDELQDLFGPRPAGFDERSIGDDVVRSGLIVAVIVGVALLLFVAVTVVAVILIVRASRRRGAASPPPWPPRSGPAAQRPAQPPASSWAAPDTWAPQSDERQSDETQSGETQSGGGGPQPGATPSSPAEPGSSWPPPPQ